MSRYNIGDKFVVEIDKVFNESGSTLYRAKGMRTLVFDENGLNRLSPLVQGVDRYSYNKGAEDAWKLTKKISLDEDKDGIPFDELRTIFGCTFISEILEHPYAEVAAKVKAWEESKEIKRGDEVVLNNRPGGSRFWVTNNIDGFLYGINEHGSIFSNRDAKKYHRTGGHIDIDAWLAQIGGGENE